MLNKVFEHSTHDARRKGIGRVEKHHIKRSPGNAAPLGKLAGIAAEHGILVALGTNPGKVAANPPHRAGVLVDEGAACGTAREELYPHGAGTREGVKHGGTLKVEPARREDHGRHGLAIAVRGGTGDAASLGRLKGPATPFAANNPHALSNSSK